MKCFTLFLMVFLPLVVYSYKYVEKDRYISIDLIRQKSPKRQIVEHRELLEKYGYNFDMERPNKRSSGTTTPRTTDSINLFRYMDNEFYGQIVIGKPGKTMNVAFDTAWSMSWVLSAKCQVYITPGCRGHNLYDHEKSSYYKKNGTKYEGDEGTYNYTGFYSYENISIAHSNVTDFLFVEMVNVPDSLAVNKADGVLGLGLKDSDYEPFLYTLYRQKKIKDLIFSIYLNRDRQSNRGGNIMLGYVEKRHIHRTQFINKTIVYDEITYLPVDAGEYWQFSIDKIDFVISPKNTTVFCQNGCKGISDTSTIEIIGPQADVDAIHDMINAKFYDNKWTVDCGTINKLPKLDFILGGKPFRLSGKQYIMQERNSSHPFTICVSAFVPSNTQTDNFWVLGGAFLAQYYSIYNIADKTIGFVRAA